MNKQLTGFMTAMLIVLLSPSPSVHASEPVENTAVVTFIQGVARAYTRESTMGWLLKKGDALTKDQEVKVGENSRLEIRLPDGTFIRLAHLSQLKMGELSFNKQTLGKNVLISLGVGKLWANVKKLRTFDSAFLVQTATSVIGVRGTVYRVNVDDDKSTLVRVYDGSVYVANPPKTASKQGDQSLKPHEVTGPHEVGPPAHPVTMEEWTVIVKAMQQVSVSPQGVASKPRGFDPQADADDWVKWNQERDKESGMK